MNVTNIGNLPEPFVKAVLDREYSRGDAKYSVTQLIAPVQKTVLTKRYWDELSADVSDSTNLLIGIGFHLLMEKHGLKNALHEERFYATVNGVKISGAVDFFDGETLWDFKTTSVYSGKYEGRKFEWTKQLNAYNWLLWKNGFGAKTLKILAVYKNWSLRDAETKDGYPQRASEVIELPIYTFNEVEAFLQERVSLLEKYEEATDDSLLECTDDETWMRGEKWGVKKPKNKKATRSFETKEEAEAFLKTASSPEDFEIVFKPGTRNRCNSVFCPASLFCSQHLRNTISEDEDGKDDSND